MTMRILFWGTPGFSIPSLDMLCTLDEHEVVAVVSQPDKPRGRGRRTVETPVKKRCLELGLQILQPVKTRDESFLESVEALEPDISAIVAYGKILHREILDLPPSGSVCLHPSLLPLYRGAAPIQRTIMDGCTETGVTLFQIDEGMDTGPILLVRHVPMDEQDTLDSLSARLSEVCAEILVEGLSLISSGEAKPQPQRGNATLAPKVSKEEARIQWEHDAPAIARRVRALCSKPGASTIFDGRTLKIYRAAPVTEEYSAEPGTVVRTPSDSIVVATGRGWLALTELQLEGKNRMSASSFQRGKRMEVGTGLG